MTDSLNNNNIISLEPQHLILSAGTHLTYSSHKFFAVVSNRMFFKDVSSFVLSNNKYFPPLFSIFCYLFPIQISSFFFKSIWKPIFNAIFLATFWSTKWFFASWIFCSFVWNHSLPVLIYFLQNLVYDDMPFWSKNF